MGSSTRALILLLQDNGLPTQRCSSQLPSRHDPTKVARTWSYLLSGYLAIWPSDTRRDLNLRITSDHAGALPPEVPCFEKFSTAYSWENGLGYDGGRTMEKMKRNIQPRVQCKLSYDSD